MNGRGVGFTLRAPVGLDIDVKPVMRAGVDWAEGVPDTEPRTARYICDVHGFTNHVMGAPGGTVFCIECSAALARMIYNTDHLPEASDQII